MFVPVVLRNKEPLPIATLFPPVALEENAVVAPIETFEEMFPFPVLINKLLIVLSDPLVEMEPVTPNEPVIWADPVNGNGEIYPSK